MRDKTGDSFTFLIVALFSIVVLAQNNPSVCPRALSNIKNLCERFKCVHNLTKDDCPSDTFFTEGLTMCGCCPGCAKFIAINDPKDPKAIIKCTTSTGNRRSWPIPCDDGPSCPIQINQCMPGLTCDTTSGLCSLPTGTIDPCTQECRYKQSLKRLSMGHWDPDCNADGSYKPKQCKGDHVTGICFCVDSCGRRIFGREFRVDAKNMTCDCSRQVSEMQNLGHTMTLHCSPNGNYEPLQCDTDSNLCYCVDERSGRLNGAVVPQHQWRSLPCLTPNVTNFMKDGHYLRKCESLHAANRKIINEGVEHGLETYLHKWNCDSDGSYGPLQVSGTRSICVYKNGTTIKDFFSLNVPQGQMDCNCARDEFLYKHEGRPFAVPCAGGTSSGNYPTWVDFGSYASCIDRDGIHYGDLVPSKYSCCLDKTCILVTQQKCYNEFTNRDGYKGCCDWPFGGPCSE